MNDINNELRDAAKAGDAASLKDLLLREVGDPLLKNKDGWTVLMTAAVNGHFDCVRLLLPVSDPLVQDNFGSTALMWSAYSGELDCVQLLLSVSDCMALDEKGIAASYYARRKNHTDIADFIDAFVQSQSELSALISSTCQGTPRKANPRRV